MTKIINVDGTNLRIEKIEKLIELSVDQTNALNSIKEWLYREIKCPDDCFYRLTGSAGTGKTTLLSKLVKDLEGIYRFKTCVSAPTHKAKKVITAKTKCPNAETVQALLGLKPDLDLENFDVNNPVFSPVNNKKLASYKLILIDESSMINNDLYATIKSDAIKFGVKLLFIGDLLQLPPVKESYSKALVEPINGYDLTEIIRQQNTNPLLEILNILREDILNSTHNYIDFLKLNPLNMTDKEGYKVLGGAEFGQELISAFKSLEYQQDRNYVRYISWTNQAIQTANSYIRKNIYANTTNPITEGELLLGYKTVTDDENFPLIVNSEDYIVDKYSVDTDHNGIKVIYATVKYLDVEGDKGHTLKILYPDNENYLTYLSEREPLLETAKSKKGKYWRFYFEFRNRFALLESIMGNPPYAGAKPTLIDSKDISYGYGITIHKSQGSTYDTVFVNMKDINNNPDAIERKKLLYVALSRASNKVYINL